MKVFSDILPAEFGVILLIFALILTISPYASGHDFGIFNIPDFSPKTCKTLKLAGPLSLIIAILLHIKLPFCDVPIYKMVTDANACGTIEEDYIITPSKPKKCSDSSFPQVGWRYTEETTGSSGWIGGGHSDVDYCNTLANSFITGRSISSSHNVETVTSRSEERWSGTFGRTRQYNYHCTVKVSWEPIYEERLDGNVCGMTTPVLGKRQVPDTCKKLIGTSCS